MKDKTDTSKKFFLSFRVNIQKLQIFVTGMTDKKIITGGFLHIFILLNDRLIHLMLHILTSMFFGGGGEGGGVVFFKD